MPTTTRAIVRSIAVTPSLLALLALVGCGPGGGDDTTSLTIQAGPQGGSWSLPGSATLEIPAGALAAPVAITVTPIAPPPSDLFVPVGPFYDFAPDGLAFEPPARLRLPVQVAEADIHRLSGVWRAAGGAWHGLPGWTEPGVGNDLTLVTEVRHFSEGGAGVWATVTGACCNNGDCTVAPVLDCPATFTGPGIPCELAGRDVCSYLVCCESVGDSFEQRFPGECAARGGVEVASDRCALGCCLIGAEASERTRGRCEALGGRFDPVEAHCGNVCCVADGEASLLTPTECAARQGTVQPRAACETVVCCAVAELRYETLQAFCPAPEFRVVEPAECAALCCLTAAGATLTSATECDAAGGVGYAAAACEPVCCGWLDRAIVMELPAVQCRTEDGYTRLDAAECDEVCCIGDGVGSFEYRHECEVDGFAVHPVEQCEEVCCAAAELRYETVQVLCPAPPFTVVEPAECVEVCCALDHVFELMALGSCRHAGGTVAADPALCDAVCCESEGVVFLADPQDCAEAGGVAVDPTRCPAASCAAAAPAAESEAGAVTGNLADYGADSDGTVIPCADGYPTDPHKTAGPDLVQPLIVPAGACVMAKATLVGYNPALYVLDGCGVAAPTCHAFNYGGEGGAAVFPVVYPYPGPGDVRKSAVQYCNAGAEPGAVALWLDRGTEQSDPGGGDPPAAPTDFRFDWRVLGAAPQNDRDTGALPLAPDAGAPLEGLAFATDQYAATGVPGLAEGQGAGTPDLYYTFVPPADGPTVFGLNLLNADPDSLEPAGHYLALLGPDGTGLAASSGTAELRVQAALSAGARYTLVFDGGTLAADTLFEVFAAPYAGPPNDACASATVIAGLPFLHAGTTVGAVDDFYGTGSNCRTLVGVDAGLTCPDVVYQYTPPADAVVQLSLTALTAGYTPSVLVTTDCATAPALECADGLVLPAGGSGSVTFRVAAGTSYFFVVDGSASWDPVKAGEYRFELTSAELAAPDDCASAQAIPETPFDVTLNGRNLSDRFSGGASECDDYVCCRTGTTYGVVTWCEGVVEADWSLCEPVCCSIGTLSSEELRGNCLQYGGTEGCPGAELPVSCCQVFATPQLAYIFAEGCGMPLEGGIQGTPVAAEYCEPVCCGGHGYQKRGNCENFGAPSRPFPPLGNACSATGATVGAGQGDAVFSYTAADTGILRAYSLQPHGGPTRYLYGFRERCEEGAHEGCDALCQPNTSVSLVLAAGETGFVVLDGFDPAAPFGNTTIRFEFTPGLPENRDCAAAAEIPALPFVHAASLGLAGNDVVLLDSPACPGVSHITNGPDLVYRFDPGPAPVDLVAGVVLSDTRPMLLALDACDAAAPLVSECIAVDNTTGYVKPQLLLSGVSSPVYFVVEAPLGQPWGATTFVAFEATPPPNDTCAGAISIPGVPWEYIGHTVGAGADYEAPADSCAVWSFSDTGAGPDVVFRLEIDADIVAAYDSLAWTTAGTTFLTEVWVMKNGCTSCYSAGAAFLAEGSDYVLGDVLYFVVDAMTVDSAGIFAARLSGQ